MKTVVDLSVTSLRQDQLLTFSPADLFANGERGLWITAKPKPVTMLGLFERTNGLWIIVE